ncbi:hypothetical protein FO488_05245 [Geobacter sp. FeAm09]|uniref:hypothetical protein n=1 Tax=Geobacter sp. FeAm09 TaxID=2597769 RepID=UPI0011EFF2BE|nr:hypothetical protein [Geobacter sp. FeAm09]QEM67615.1 hypothetical protein FO488_05245 [Geobacter sp. FeAm09]
MKKTGVCWFLALATLAGCGGSSSSSGPLYSSGTSYETTKNTVSTIAGSAGVTGTADGIGTAARFSIPNGMAVSSDKTTLYMTDYGSNTIRQLVLATGQVTTIAGIAGTSGSLDATGTAATFHYPHDIVTDGTYLYVTDMGNHTIRKINIATKAVTTLAGKAGTAGTADGTASAATFNGPAGIAISGSTLYVTDANSNTIRQVDATSGAVTTIAGSAGTAGSANGTGTAATFNVPAGITTDGTNLYVSDFNNNLIRTIVISSKAVTTLAGSTSYYGSADGVGASASFYAPNGITTDGTNLYVTDANNHIVRKIVIASGTVTTIAGVAATSGSSDGSKNFARFYFPVGIASDGTNLYVADANNSTIREIQ